MGAGWEGGRLVREGICVHFQLIHTAVQQKPVHYKATILPLTININEKRASRHFILKSSTT